MEIRELRKDTITPNEAKERARLLSLVDPRRLRTDPPLTASQAVDGMRPAVATYAHNYWGLFDGERMAGMAETAGAIDAPNADVCELGIWADPADGDGHVLRHLLFDHVAAVERARGRTRFWGWGDLAHPETTSFWEDELGYTLAYDERVSRCVIADIDDDMLREWVTRAQQRASGYHLRRADAPFNDEEIGYLAQGLEAMNDAPLDDLDHEPDRFDVERAREIEQIHLSTNSEFRAVFAIESATGELAGYTATRVSRSTPAAGSQNDTVTLAAHRNRGIGRLLKADMIYWLRDVRPEVVHLTTGNAESNRAMLAINEQLGFRDIIHHGVWHKKDELPSGAGAGN